MYLQILQWCFSSGTACQWWHAYAYWKSSFRLCISSMWTLLEIFWKSLPDIVLVFVLTMWELSWSFIWNLVWMLGVRLHRSSSRRICQMLGLLLFYIFGNVAYKSFRISTNRFWAMIHDFVIRWANWQISFLKNLWQKTYHFYAKNKAFTDVLCF